MVPARAVEHRSLELVEALEVGELGMVQHAGSGNHDVDIVAVPALRLDVPRAVVEPAARDRVAEPDLPLDVVLVRDTLEVPLDLVARRESVAPFGRGRERIGVEVGRDVAREPRIRVLPPRPTDTVRFLVDGEVREAGVLQLDRAEDSGHAGADDREPQCAAVVDQRCAPSLGLSRSFSAHPFVIRPHAGYLISC